MDTDYCDFYRYLRESKEKEEIDLLDFLIDYTDLNGINISLWKDFENELGNADFRRMLDVSAEYQNDKEMDTEIDHDYYGSQVEMRIWECKRIVESLPKIFSRWISTIKIENAIKKMDFEKLFTGDDFFLTFNYTNMLEKIYRINNSKISHIHGMVMADECCDIMIGHGRPYKNHYNYTEFNPVITDMTSIDTIEKCVNGTRRMYNMWKKDVDSNLMKYKNIFDTMQGVMNIYSFGFSYSEVDLPYIQAIVARIKSSSEVCWYFNSYDRGSMSIWENNIKKLGYKGRFDCFDVCV